MNENTTKTKDPKSINGYAWDALKGLVTLTRNQNNNFKIGLENLHESILEFNPDAELPTLEHYINLTLKKTIGNAYKTFSLKGEGGTIRNNTPSIQSVYDGVASLIKACDDHVIVNGVPMLPNANGDYKPVSLSFTVRKDDNNGLSAKDVQSNINKTVTKLLGETSEVIEDAETETDNEVINQ